MEFYTLKDFGKEAEPEEMGKTTEENVMLGEYRNRLVKFLEEALGMIEKA